MYIQYAIYQVSIEEYGGHRFQSNRSNPTCNIRVTKVVADHGSEFSGRKLRPNNYENVHKTFWPFKRFRIEGRKQQNSEYIFEVDFLKFSM